jgi:hypothetical protein
MSQPLKTAPPPTPEPPADEPYVSRIDRRTALAWVGVVGAAAAVGAGVVVYGPKTGGQSRGYGTDPKLATPEKAPWSRIMTPAQLQTAALMGDFILPASATAPSASALGVPDFIDEWVSAPYPEQLKDRPLILNGLNELSWRAKRRFGVDFLKATSAQRTEILRDLQAATAGAGHAFFKRFRWMVVGAYYTTPAGFKDIGYIGNVPRASDPGPSEEVKAHLARELKKLGL